MFTAFCYDSDYTVYYCSQDMHIYQLSLSQVKQSATEQNHDHQVDVPHSLTVSSCMGEKVIDKHLFAHADEFVVDLCVLEQQFHKKQLLIITTHSIYSKRLLKAKLKVSQSNFFNSLLTPLKIFSISSFLETRLKVRQYTIADVKMVGNSIFIKVLNQATTDSKSLDSETPFFYILKVSFDSVESDRDSTWLVDSALDQEPPLRVSSTRYLPLFQSRTKEFWADPIEPDQIYFSLGKGLFVSPTISARGDDSGQSASPACKLLYRSKFEVRFLQFSSRGDFVICSDKPDRAILLDKATWKKKLDFQLRLGEILTLVLSEQTGLVFV